MKLIERVKKIAKRYKGIEKCVLAYSGGLDTSVIASLLNEIGIEVITLTLDFGQMENMEEIERKAYEVGAKKHYSLNVKEEFICEYVYRGIKANSLYEGVYPNSTALGRPLLAKYLVKIAEKERADAVAHGSTGKGNDQIRIENGVRALSDFKIIAPVRDWGLWRDEEIEYAREKNLLIQKKKKIYSTDQNLWGRSVECGAIENASREVPEDAYEWTVSPKKAPNKPIYVEVKFEKGIPTQICIYNKKQAQKSVKGIKVIEELNLIGGAHGVGRIEHIEDRVIGFKSREVYECPAALILISAHKDLEKFILTKDELDIKRIIDTAWSELVYCGKWFSPLREELEAFIDKTQEIISGNVMVKLFKGNISVVSRESKNTLYDLDVASYKKGTKWNQEEGGAFSKLYGLQTVAGFRIRQKCI